MIKILANGPAAEVQRAIAAVHAAGHSKVLKILSDYGMVQALQDGLCNLTAKANYDAANGQLDGLLQDVQRYDLHAGHMSDYDGIPVLELLNCLSERLSVRACWEACGKALTLVEYSNLLYYNDRTYTDDVLQFSEHPRYPISLATGEVAKKLLDVIAGDQYLQHPVAYLYFTDFHDGQKHWHCISNTGTCDLSQADLDSRAELWVHLYRHGITQVLLTLATDDNIVLKACTVQAPSYDEMCVAIARHMDLPLTTVKICLAANSKVSS